LLFYRVLVILNLEDTVAVPATDLLGDFNLFVQHFTLRASPLVATGYQVNGFQTPSPFCHGLRNLSIGLRLSHFGASSVGADCGESWQRSPLQDA
jgi:hypothetical protein